MWLLIPILIYTLIFLAVRHVYSYWRRKGFPHEKSNLAWAFLKKAYKREFNCIEAISETYYAGKERFVGIYFLFHPILLIRDLSVIRALMENPGYFSDTKWDYIRGYRKYNLMEKISPVFNASRLEAVFRIIEQVGNNAINHLNFVVTSSETKSSDDIDLQQLLRTYTMNIIANLIYGSEIDLFKQTDSVFKQYLNNAAHHPAFNSYTYNRIPKKSSLTYRLRDIIRENVERREDGGTIRKDLLQVLIKFRNGNDIEQKEKLCWHIENLFEREKVLSINKLAHITEHLLENGMSTISSTAVLALFEVLQQPELKTKILDEIKTHLQPNDKKPNFNYDSLKNLKLMDLCIQETARKYPSVAVIERTCRKDFQMPDCKTILSEGKSLMIPLLAIQRDERYFEDPLSFKPQRFLHDSYDNKANCLISFGLVAKTCIAQNFVKLVIKCALAKLFLNFYMEPVQAEKIEICYNETPFIKSKEGLRVKMKPTKKMST